MRGHSTSSRSPSELTKTPGAPGPACVQLTRLATRISARSSYNPTDVFHFMRGPYEPSLWAGPRRFSKGKKSSELPLSGVATGQKAAVRGSAGLVLSGGSSAGTEGLRGKANTGHEGCRQVTPRPGVRWASRSRRKPAASERMGSPWTKRRRHRDEDASYRGQSTTS